MWPTKNDDKNDLTYDQSHDRFGHLVIWFGLLCLLSIGCSPGENELRGTRVAVEGIVTLDGESLPAGRIVYICDQGAGGVKSAASIVSGFYSFSTQNGPTIGTARVEIYPEELELEEFESVRGGDSTKRLDFTKITIPAEYNIRSTLTVDVQPDLDSNLFSFHLTTK